MQALAIVGSLLAGAVSLWGCGGGDEVTTAKPGEGEKGSVQAVWNNHFDAFATFDVEKIMNDYDDESMIATFNDACFDGVSRNSSYAMHKGKPAIKTFFEKLFVQLNETLANIDSIGPSGDMNSEAGGSPVVMEGEGGAFNANVFLTWRTKNLEMPIEYATDSFSFRKSGETYMIDYQTIVTTESNPTPTCVEGQKGPDTGEEAIYAAWGNHLNAFGTKDATKIMNEYDENSIVQVFDNRVKKYSKFEGTVAIKQMFVDLFKAIKDGGEGVEVGLLEIDPKHNSVFLVWKSISHPRATDTFIFNGKMIARQNIVVTTKVPTVSAEHGMLV